MKRIFAYLVETFIFPIIKIFTAQIEGKENIPKRGAFILASNHINSSDHYFIGLALRERSRDIHFIGAPNARFIKWYTAIVYYLADVISIDRNRVDREALLKEAEHYLRKGEIIAIYPEGNTNRNNILLKGKTGAAELALRTGLPIVPIGMSSKRKGTMRKRVIKIGKPLYFTKETSTELSQKLLRKTTKKIMMAISSLSEKPYPYDD